MNDQFRVSNLLAQRLGEHQVSLPALLLRAAAHPKNQPQPRHLRQSVAGRARPPPNAAGNDGGREIRFLPKQFQDLRAQLGELRLLVLFAAAFCTKHPKTPLAPN